MYIAWRGRAGEATVDEGGHSVTGATEASVAAVSAGGGDDERESRPGRQASISTNRTRQSLPPLYESERCSGLCRFQARVS
jgi:hypothetical protein